MATIRTASGEVIETETLPQDSNELVRCILDLHDLQLDALPEDELEVDPSIFLEEIRDYLRSGLGIKKLPAVEFRIRGRIGGVSYWVFFCEVMDGHPAYLLVVRNDYVTEIVCSEQAVTYLEADTGTLHNRLLAPEQAALLEYCTTDYNPPPRQ